MTKFTTSAIAVAIVTGFTLISGAAGAATIGSNPGIASSTSPTWVQMSKKKMMMKKKKMMMKKGGM